jgi:hypothetical protein
MAYCEIKAGVGVGATWEEAPLKSNKRMNKYPKKMNNTPHPTIIGC